MKLPLNKALEEHNTARSLTDEQLDTLKAIQETQPVAARIRLTRISRFGMAAMMLLVVALTISLPDFSDDGDIANRVAAEVARNHLNLKPLEVDSADLPDIQAYFDRLDFMPQGSVYLADRGLQLQGGRYCSIQGVNAAQLRLRATDRNSVHSLYEVGYDATVFKQFPDFDAGETPAVVWARGIKVTMWVEKGILFALAEEP